MCVCCWSFLTVCDSVDCNQPGSSTPRIFLSKNTGVGCHFLLHGGLPVPGIEPTSRILYHWATRASGCIPQQAPSRPGGGGWGTDSAVSLAIFQINNCLSGTQTFVSAVQENSFSVEKTHLRVTVIQAANFTENISGAKFFLSYGGQRWGNCAYRAKLFYGFPWLPAFFFTTD